MQRWTNALGMAPILVGLWVSAVQAQAGGVPAYVPVQGYLTDEAGVPIDGDVTLVLSLYTRAEDIADDPESAPFHTEQQVVEASGGEFTAFLGDAAPLNLSEFAAKPAGLVFLRFSPPQTKTRPSGSRIATEW